MNNGRGIGIVCIVWLRVSERNMDRKPNGSALVLVGLAIFFMTAHESDGYFLATIRKLAEGIGHNNNAAKNKPPTLQISPSPAPAPASDDGLSIRSCTGSLKTCHTSQINITACLISSSNANAGLFLLVQNDGDNSLEVNVTTSSESQNITISKHGITKVNVSEGRSSSIVLNAGNEVCVIRFVLSAPNNSFFRQFPYYAGYATPLNGVYLLLLSALVFGGMWACCMLGKKGHHVGGVPYQELEMGHPESPSADNEETSEHWDQGWDDDWGETKAVKSPRARQNGNAMTNGLATSRSSERDGWENNWDD